MKTTQHGTQKPMGEGLKSEKKIRKYLLTHTQKEGKHTIPKFLGCSKGISKREVHNDTSLYQEVNSQIIWHTHKRIIKRRENKPWS